MIAGISSGVALTQEGDFLSNFVSTLGTNVAIGSAVGLFNEEIASTLDFFGFGPAGSVISTLGTVNVFQQIYENPDTLERRYKRIVPSL